MTSGTYGLDIRMWDVELGTAMLAKAADKTVVIDLGASGFSPMQHISERHKISEIDYMVITHPHEDHIRDILQLINEGIHVKILARNEDTRPLIEQKIEEENNDCYVDIAQNYLDWTNKYKNPASEDPSSNEWADGATFSTYYLDIDDVKNISKVRYKQMNCLSIITIIEREGFKMISCGDVLNEGIEKIMDERQDIMNAIEDAHVLVAPHHGRESGYNSELLDHINPDIVLISDKTDNGDNANGYYQKPDGIPVYDEPDQEWTGPRTVLTTRNDGRLRVRANHKDSWIVSYYDQFSDRKAKGNMARDSGKFDR